jgi:hypothetical protein
MLVRSTAFALRPSYRSFSTSTCRPTVAESIESLAAKFKQAVQQSHSEEYRGPTEKGLRMLVFGKPGSGKVDHSSFSFKGLRANRFTGYSKCEVSYDENLMDGRYS